MEPITLFPPPELNGPGGGSTDPVQAAHGPDVVPGFRDFPVGLPEHIAGYLRIGGIGKDILRILHAHGAQDQAGRFEHLWYEIKGGAGAQELPQAQTKGNGLTHKKSLSGNKIPRDNVQLHVTFFLSTGMDGYPAEIHGTGSKSRGWYPDAGLRRKKDGRER